MNTESNGASGGTTVLDPPATDPTAALQRLDSLLELSNVRMKLADSAEGPGLDPALIDLMEAEYRKFLALQLLHPGADIVPCEIVDEMWHRHILDTAAYREDYEATSATSSATSPTSGCEERPMRRRSTMPTPTRSNGTRPLSASPPPRPGSAATRRNAPAKPANPRSAARSLSAAPGPACAGVGCTPRLRQ